MSVADTIRRRAEQSKKNLGEAKAEFISRFNAHPSDAIDWNAKSVIEAEKRYVWWHHLVKRLDAGETPTEAIKNAKEDADNLVDSFFGSNSTCLYRVAIQRTVGETYHNLLRREIPALENAANAERVGE